MKVGKRKIIYCQGDKKELEEITGEKFQYIPRDEIEKVFSQKRDIDRDNLYSSNIFPTYIRAVSGGRRISSANRELNIKAYKIKADAIIHYQEGITKIGEGEEYRENYGYALGTPLRRVK